MASDNKVHATLDLKEMPEIFMQKMMPSLLPWDKFSQWAYCICVVTFDLELGQAMEFVYPPHIKLTEKEKTNICYLAFPDSNSGCMGDTQYFFRIRQGSGRRKLNSSQTCYNKYCSTALKIDPSYFYGFTYFRQVRDKTIRRGYFQKSVVLLTKLPFTNLFSHILNLVAPQFFESGEPSIEAACHDIDQWPAPTPGLDLRLPIFGTIYQVRIPTRIDKLGVTPPNNSPDEMSIQPAPVNLDNIHNTELFCPFLPVIVHIQMLWELVITTEPIVVLSSSPSVCSEMVQALISMIWPLKFCSDYRPFFTIHDSEFKEFTSKMQKPPPVILGVTNPFFAKTLQHWPHIIRLGDLGNRTPSHKTKIKKGGNLKTLDSKPGLYTTYKPFLQKDKDILKKLLKGLQNDHVDDAQNHLLRRHLLELTQSFMIPLERYMASLMPLQKNISPYKAGTPTMKPFKPEEFLKTVETSGPQLTTGIKGDWVGLYKKFFKCANFVDWYDNRFNEVRQKLQTLHIEAIGDADLINWIQSKQEVEIVDMVLKIREKLSSAEAECLPVLPQTIEKLQNHITGILNTLPEDLQHVLTRS